MSEQVVGRHTYPHFKGIFRLIDENNLTDLSTHHELETKLNEKDRGMTPLFLACMKKNIPIVQFLLGYGADPNIECKNVTPLYLACLYAETEIVKILLEFGADPNVLCTSRHISPLHLAASKGLITETKMLLNHKADVNAHSSKYGTPLHVAASKNHCNIATFLLGNGATVNDVNSDGETPLHICCRHGFIDLIRLLAKNKHLNPTIKEAHDGNTALHLACMHGREAPALFLISQYPDVIFVRNAERQTPVFYAPDSVRRAIKNAFTNKMLGYAEAVNSKTFSDLIFVVENKPVHAHRCILHFRCPDLLHKVKEGSHQTVIRDVEHNVFLAVMTYLYTDDVDCDKGLLPKVSAYAETLKLTRLKKLCWERGSSSTQFSGVQVPDSTFKAEMLQALNNPLFADVEFLVEGKSLFGHKRILCRQEYFRVMFSGHAQLRESQSRQVPITNVRYEVFYVLVYYTYTWEIPDIVREADGSDFAADVVVELFEATHRFMIDGLKHSVEAYMCNNLNLDNVCPLFQLADSFKSPFLLEECFDFIIMHYATLKDNADFQELPSELQQQVTDYIEKQSQKKLKQKTPKDDNFSLL